MNQNGPKCKKQQKWQECLFQQTESNEKLVLASEVKFDKEIQ